MIVILYGFRDRDIEVKSGAFDCPNCGRRKYGKRRKIESWMTIFLVPVCPWKIRTEYWRCDDCRRCFEKEGLVPFWPSGGYRRSDIQADLRSGLPIEMVACLLQETGVDEATSRSVIGEIAGDDRQGCEICALTYVSGVKVCKKCGVRLAEVKPKAAFDRDELA